MTYIQMQSHSFIHHFTGLFRTNKMTSSQTSFYCCRSSVHWSSSSFIYSQFKYMIFIMAIDLSGGQFGLKSYALFQNWKSAQREFDLKSQVWFRTKIARPEVQLSLYYIYSGIAQIQDLVSSNILLMQYWADLKLNSSILGGGEIDSFGNKSSKICHMILFVSHFPAIWSATLNKPWNLIGCFVFSVAS